MIFLASKKRIQQQNEVLNIFMIYETFLWFEFFKTPGLQNSSGAWNSKYFFLCGTIWKMFGVKDTSCLQAFALVMFFVVLACHYPVLDGFDQHFLLAAPLINLSNSNNFFLRKKSGMLGIKPGAAGSGS